VDSVDYKQLLEAFGIDSPAKDGVLPAEAGDARIIAAITRAFEGKELTKAVLGVDIYRYSKYPADQQRVIPVLFRYLYESTARSCERQEAFLFKDVKFTENFIPTGDGGFQILATPFHALVFAIYLQSKVESFNGFLLYSRLRRILGPLRLRYAVTMGSVFRLESNYFGKAIIDNARILSRDRLNRFLIDARSVQWFQEAIGSLESLLLLTRDDLPRLASLAGHQADMSQSIFPDAETMEHDRPLRTLQIQHIGPVDSKQSEFDVYNLHLQVSMRRTTRDGPARPLLVFSLGNLNSAGIAT
jgi:hypothetical protein